MHITFLTRKYPPQTGGMETFSWQLYHHLPVPHTIINAGRRQLDIVWVLPTLLWRAWRVRGRTDVYHLGDAVLAPLAPWLKWLTHKPVVVTVHGLELVYRHRLLQWLISWGLAAVDEFVCVSEYTATLLHARDVDRDHITVIAHGVLPKKILDRVTAKKKLLTHLPAGRKESRLHNTPTILLSVGRLVPRKGVAWFVDAVMPLLNQLNIRLVIVSTGPEQAAIEKIITTHQLSERVTLLGKVDDQLLQTCYAGADIFIMPNHHLPHDAEGFGFVAIEAAAAGLPVLAANVDGIPSAIHDGANGLLLPPGDTSAWVEAITHWTTHPEALTRLGQLARTYTLTTFVWEQVATDYVGVFKKAANVHD